MKKIKTAYEGWLELADDERQAYLIKQTREAVRNDELYPYVEKFEYKVWNSGLLRTWTDKTDWIRHSGTYGKTSLSLMYTCGRVVMTLKNNGNYLTLQGYKDSVGIHTMVGNIVELAKMVEEVCGEWCLDNLNQDDKLTLI